MIKIMRGEQGIERIEITVWSFIPQDLFSLVRGIIFQESASPLFKSCRDRLSLGASATREITSSGSSS